MEISVGPAGRVGDGVNAYFVYKVTSDADDVSNNNSADDNSSTAQVVDRRYSDFLWLHEQLSKQCAGFIIPPLPAKVVGILQGPEFLEHRRAGLERFLRKVVQHDELKNTNHFKSFLECSPVELTAIKTASQAVTPPSLAAVAEKTQAINSWWGKAVQRISENDSFKLLAAKAGHEITNSSTIEDPGFEELIKYVRELHNQVRVLKAKIHVADQQNKLTAGAYCDLIESLHAIADTEDAYSDIPTNDFSAVLSLLDTRARQTDSELERFELLVKDFSRWMHSVKNAISVREDRRLHYQAKLAAKKAKDAQVAARAETSNNNESTKSPRFPITPSSNNNSAEQLNHDLAAAKEEFEKVHARVVSEIARFRADKSAELRQMFADFATLQARNSAELSEVLASSMKTLQSPLPTKSTFSKSSRFLSLSSISDDSNQTEDELDDSLRKMSVRPAATPEVAAPDAKQQEAVKVDPLTDVSL
uniref:PX domain-containing protein n=1 Tax=Globisporangium ultimum (strain ATCC 200006 / CBS 805.95 / DAOM BR144) TaxID=431595 RepID=K3WEG7_GLOUD